MKRKKTFSQKFSCPENFPSSGNLDLGTGNISCLDKMGGGRLPNVKMSLDKEKGGVSFGHLNLNFCRKSY